MTGFINLKSNTFFPRKFAKPKQMYVCARNTITIGLLGTVKIKIYMLHKKETYTIKENKFESITLSYLPNKNI